MGCQHSNLSNVEDTATVTTQVVQEDEILPPLPPNIPILDFTNYLLCSYISEGAVGHVYTIYDCVAEKKRAIKLFGYTTKGVSLKEIYREIQTLSDINGIEGIVEFYGIFHDTLEGIAPNKIDRTKSYPIICMELLEGGDMFDRIQERKIISEKYIVSIFYHVLYAINGMHKKGFLHRDLKLENILLTSNDDDAIAKIIDFGNVVKMNEDGLYISDLVNGTIGYIAPESFVRKEYSSKTDIWQAGVVLYSLLSGYQPFNPYKIEQTIEAKYMPMIGDGWDNISNDAKDLISKILVRSPEERLSIEQIFAHPWVSGSAPERPMTGDYYHRIKNLSLRQKMKKFFLDRDIAAGNSERKAKLQQVLPFLPNAINVRRTVSNDPMSMKTRLRGFSRATTSNDVKTSSIDVDIKLTHLRTKFIAAANGSPNPRKVSSKDEENNCHPTVTTDLNGQTGGDIDFPTFVSVLMECGLSELANRYVFNIFDIGRTGTIDLKEFLATMVAFRDSDEDRIENEEEAAIRFYFNMFDIHDTGRISLDDLKLVIGSITRVEDLSSHGHATITDIQTLFDTMDIKKTGDIDYEEFKQFYQMIMISTNSGTRS